MANENATGYLEVGITAKNEVVINHPDLKPDENGVGHIVFSISQAQHLSHLLAVKASEAWNNARMQDDEARRAAAEAIPVDRTAIVLTNGSPVTPDRLETKANGQQKEYVVLSESERAKGFVRPVRRSYVHEKCGVTTTMSQSIAETYARDPKFYSGTFCSQCGKHFPVGPDGEFVWLDDGQKVGT